MAQNDAAGNREVDKIALTCSPEYKDYLYNAKHDVWSLVTLKAPTYNDEDDENKRAPIDIVAVIDKSGSMSGEKISLVRKTLEFVLTQLTEKDRFCIVTYDTNVNIQYKLSNMNADNKTTALDKIRKIQSGTSTNLCGGLMKGLCQIIDRSPNDKNEVASVLLFTDGLANVGIRSSQGIVQAMKHPKQFDGPSLRDDSQAAPHQSWLQKIGVKREEKPAVSKGDSKPSDATVYTFGFGKDHDSQMLKDISDAGNGMYYYIENEDKIAESFGHCLGGLLSTVAQGIQLEVAMEDGVVIKEVHTGRPFEIRDDKKSVKVNMGDLQSEESRDIVMELSIDAVSMPYETTPQPLFEASGDYFSVITNSLENIRGKLSVLRPAEGTVHDASTSNVHVNKERARVRMANVMKSAQKQADSGDLSGARSLMSAEIEGLKAERSLYVKLAKENDEDEDDDIEESYNAMVDDLELCTSNFKDSQSWRMGGQNQQLNIIQSHVNQRSSNVASSAYMTKGKAKRKEAAKKFVKK